MGFSDFRYSERGDNSLERKDLLDGIRVAKRYIRRGLSILNKPFIDEVIELCLQTKRYKTALKLINPLLQVLPADFELLHAHAYTLFNLQEYTEAFASISEAVRLEPTRSESLLLATEICIQSGKIHAAEEYIARMISYAPGDAELLLEIGKLLFNAEQYYSSHRYIKMAKNIASTDTDILFQEALVLEARNMLAESLAAYDNYLYYKSNCPLGWYNRGLVLIQMNRLQEALESCSFAYSIDEQFTEALFTLANLYADTNKSEEAIAHFNRLLLLEPTNAYAYYNLGALYLDKNSYEHAIYNFTRCLEIFPENVDAYNERGYCFLKLGSLENALSDLRSAILYETPQVAQLRLDPVTVKRKRQRIKMRIKKLLIRVKIEPKEHLSSLIDNLLILRKHNLAIKMVRKHTTLSADRTFSLALLAKIYFILGNTILGYALLSQAAPANTDLFNSVKCLMPKTGVSRLFYALFGITKDLIN